MKRIVWDRPQLVGEWVCARLHARWVPSECTAIGLASDGVVVAGVMFDHFNGRSIAMHVASEGRNWLTRDFLRSCFGYAFNQLKVGKVIGLVDSTNIASKRFCHHLGFSLEATVTGAAKEGDLFIYSMTPDQCRWIGEKNG